MTRMTENERRSIINKLEKMFPLNNPGSWYKVSNKQLKEWKNEYFKEKPCQKN